MKDKFLIMPKLINTTQDITKNKKACTIVKLDAPF
jgi:ABC-type metal ion transport system substrate-binding protein